MVLQMERESTQAWASWLSGVCKWKFMITLTLAEAKNEFIGNSLVTKFVKELRKYDKQAFFFITMEMNGLREVHFHGLLDTKLNATEIASMWPYGFSTIKPITKEKGCIEYVVKYINKKCENFTENLPKSHLDCMNRFLVS